MSAALHSRANEAWPSGTVTFVFTDIEGSTRLWSHAPEAMAGALARHDEIVQTAMASHHGVVFSTSGDGLAACFTRAADAVGAALAAQVALGAEHWPERAELRVRMGLHTGEAVERDGDYFGPAVNLAARVMGAAHGGQVLATATTAEVLGRAPEVEVVRLGRFRLKGIDGAVEIVGLHGRGLRWRDLPPTAPVHGRLSGLPVQRVGLVGREALVGEIQRLVTEQRLVTLVGPGGVGKTSLAIEAGHRLGPRFDRTVFVDLATVDADDHVPATFATALGTTSSSTTALVLSIGSDTVLWVVDNCEHVLDTVADVVDQILAAAPRLHILATTRELLELPGERGLVVPPLEDDAALLTLFRERAAAAGAPPIPADTDAVVVELCHRLDGLPLAVELAASRTVALSPAELLEHLDDRLSLLATGRRRGSDRHRTLRETIDWSFDLLGAREREVYSRLAVFVDWFDLDDAAAVCGLGEIDTLDAVRALVAKSLLVRSEQRGHARFRYLESIRDHAWDELTRTDGVNHAMALMVDRVIDRLEWLVEQMWESDEPPVADITGLLPAHRHAARWCIDQRDLERGSRLFVPFAAALVAAFPEALPPVLELAALTPMSHPRWMELEIVALLARMFQGRFHDYRPSIETILEIAGSWDATPSDVLPVIALAAAIAGDYATCVAAWRPLIDDTPRGRVATAFAISSEHLLRGGTPAELDQILEQLAFMHTPFQRASVLCAALGSAQTVAPERIGELAVLADGLCPEVASFDQHRRQCLGEWHLVRHELHDALEVVVPASASARRRGELSALVPTLVLHALVLQAVDRSEDAARLMGHLPRRWSLFHTAHIDPFHDWLEERLDAQTRRRLAAEGAATSLDKLFELAPKALAERNPTADS